MRLGPSSALLLLLSFRASQQASADIILPTVAKPTVGASGNCEPWCIAPCNELNGDVMVECSGCAGSSHACQQGAPGYPKPAALDQVAARATARRATARVLEWAADQVNTTLRLLGWAVYAVSTVTTTKVDGGAAPSTNDSSTSAAVSPISSGDVWFSPLLLPWIPPWYWGEPAMTAVANPWRTIYPEMLSLLVFLVVTPPALMALAWHLQASNHNGDNEGSGGRTDSRAGRCHVTRKARLWHVCLGFLGYTFFNFHIYCGHRMTHFLWRLKQAEAQATDPPLEPPHIITAFFDILPYCDTMHHVHHADPSDYAQLVEVLDEWLLLLCVFGKISLVLGTILGASWAAAIVLWKAQVALLSICQRGGLVLQTPLEALGSVQNVCCNPGSILKQSIFLSAASSASFFSGVIFTVTVYEGVHLSSHWPEEVQPSWMWAWSSAHRVHHRDARVNFGFHDGLWDWVFGTLAM
mmetsp:Transcript_2079/g.5844  ORF Transcript_2079/g.5844 Transcript_2079/m.5844 type:complete len:467 (-) Transcript_2079:413-1813(-)